MNHTTLSTRSHLGARLLWTALALAALALSLLLAPSIWAQTLTPATLSAYPGASSATTVVVFTNTSGHHQAFAPTSATLTGKDAAAFTVLPACDTLDARTQACVLYVQFKAPATGTFTATLNLTYLDIPSATQTGRPTAFTSTTTLTGIGLPLPPPSTNPQLSFLPTRATFAGTGAAATTVANGLATRTPLNGPLDVLPDNLGNLYIADAGDNAIRKVDAAGYLTLIAGTGTAGYTGDDGPALDATLNHPAGLALDAAGNLFVADTGNAVIRRIDTSGRITTIAGKPHPSTTPLTLGGDNGPALDATFLSPTGLVFDSHGNLYIADSDSNEVRRIDPTGQITAYAGIGGGPFVAASVGFSGDGGPATDAQLFHPQYLALDAAGNLYIADHSNSRIRKVEAATGLISTVAGFGGLAGDSFAALAESTSGQPARFAELLPSGIAAAPSGGLFLADSQGPLFTLDPTGILHPFAYAYPSAVAYVGSPAGMALDASGALFVADRTGHQIVRFSPSNTLHFGTETLQHNSPAQTLILTNSGGAPLRFAATPYTLTPGFTLTGGSCAFHAPLAPGATCTVEVAFSPTQAGPLTGTLSFYSNDPSSPLQANLSGTAIESTPQAALSPSSLDFGNGTALNTASALVVTLSNHGTAPLTGIVPSLTGANPGLFAYTSACGPTLAPGASCNIALRFTPANTGKFAATLSVADNASGSPHTTTLTGTYTPQTIPSNLTLAINETIHTADNVYAAPSTILLVNELIHTKDAIAPQASTLLTINELIHTKDLPATSANTLLIIDDTIHTKDAPAPQASTLLAVAESIHARDSLAPTSSTLLAIAETVHTKDAPASTPSSLLTVNDTIHTKDAPVP